MSLDFSAPLTGEARCAAREETELSGATHVLERPATTDRLMGEVCQRDNLQGALRRVQANKGSVGVEGMPVGDLTDYLKQHWPAIRDHLLSGTYEPQPVRRVKHRTPGRRGALAGYPATQWDRTLLAGGAGPECGG